jgi:hypothetical protein
MINQAMGQPKIKSITTHVTKSLFNKTITLEIVAPLAFLIPISFCDGRGNGSGGTKGSQKMAGKD